jgi:hypothetical protein
VDEWFTLQVFIRGVPILNLGPVISHNIAGLSLVLVRPPDLPGKHLQLDYDQLLPEPSKLIVPVVFFSFHAKQSELLLAPLKKSP